MARVKQPKLLSRTPPKDVETERRLVSVLLITDDAVTPDESFRDVTALVALVQREDFADPFYAWLFEVIAEARRVWPTLDRQLKFVLARPNRQAAAEKFGVEHLPSALAHLLLTREGAECAGRVASARLYVEHLRRVRDYRERVEMAIGEVRAAYEQWDSDTAGGLVSPD